MLRLPHGDLLAKGPGSRSSAIGKFLWRFGSQGQSVKPALEFIREGSVHHSVALEGVLRNRS